DHGRGPEDAGRGERSVRDAHHRADSQRLRGRIRRPRGGARGLVGCRLSAAESPGPWPSRQPTADSRPQALFMIRAAMAVTVKIPTQLRSVTGGEAEAQVDDATTVGEVLDGLYDRFDGLRDRIAEDGDLRRFVNVYVGGEDIRFLDGLETAVEDGDEVT